MDLCLLKVQEEKNPIQGRIQELAEILNYRADKVKENLSSYFKYVEVKNYIVRFENLHKRHIESLKKGNIIQAHELLLEIHKLSAELEAKEFWKRNRIETPDILYKLKKDAFLRGIMICTYMVGAMERYSSAYPKELMFSICLSNSFENYVEAYNIILNSNSSSQYIKVR